MWIQRLILLEREWQKRLESGTATRVDLAEEHECSRPRVTQILNLLRLCDEAQELTLNVEQIEVGGCRITERGLRSFPVLPADKQMEVLQKIMPSK